MTATQRRRGAAQKYDELLTAHLGFVLTPKQKAKLIRYSDETGLSLGDILRDCIDAIELADDHAEVRDAKTA